MWRDLGEGTAGIAAERERPQSAADAGNSCTNASAEARNLARDATPAISLTATPRGGAEENLTISDASVEI
jgi:hypothetical protein